MNMPQEFLRLEAGRVRILPGCKKEGDYSKTYFLLTDYTGHSFFLAETRGEKASLKYTHQLSLHVCYEARRFSDLTLGKVLREEQTRNMGS